MTRKQRKFWRVLTTGAGAFLLLSALCGAIILSTNFNVAPWVSSVLFVTAIYGTGVIIFGFYAFRSR